MDVWLYPPDDKDKTRTYRIEKARTTSPKSPDIAQDRPDRPGGGGANGEFQAKIGLGEPGELLRQLSGPGDPRQRGR